MATGTRQQIADPARRPGLPAAARLRYLTVRITGVALAVLALGHFAMTHVAHDVAATGAGFVARRWTQALWVGWDLTMLLCAAAHVGTAMVVVVRDYRSGATSRRRWMAAMLATTSLIVLVGLVALVLGAVRAKV